jgi:hypothetical protein
MKTEKYKPQHRGKNIIISWHEFWHEFIIEVNNGDHEDWLPPTAPREAIEMGADVYADQMIEWYGHTHMSMYNSSDGYELDAVRQELKEAGFDFEEDEDAED